MNKRIVLALILTGCLVFLAPHLPQVSAATVEELQSQIQQLLQIIQQLQQQLNALINSQSQQPGGPYCFSQTLRYGMTSPEVKNLQIVLGVSPTGYFGDLTLAALKEFQQANNIRVTGEVGPETREVLNSKYCVPVIPTTTTKPITSSCGWCGNTCVRKTVGMSCPDVMPPLGVECKEVNGVCTTVPLVPTTKYSCVTARGTIPTNTYSTCIPDTNGTFNSLEECQKVCGVASTCTDSDGYDTTSQGAVVYRGTSYQDYCLSNNTLIEYSCGDANDLKTTQVVCPPGAPLCQEGVCTVGATSCTDSDGGYNIYVKGEVTYSVGGVTKKYIDTCVSPELLEEHTCQAVRDGTMLRTECPVGYTCQDGACKASTTSYLRIISPNGGEKFSVGQAVPIYFTSSLTDKQTSGITFQLYKKTNDSFGKMYVQDIAQEVNTGSPYQWIIPNNIQPGDYYIYAAAVNLRDVPVKEIYDFSDNSFSILASTSSICTDSDGGKNYNVKGTVRYNGQTYTDTCLGIIRPTCPPRPNPCPPWQPVDYVQEYYCENGVMQQETHACGSGYTCQDGACKPSTPPTTIVPTCTDSDGYQPFVKGTVNYGGQILTDSCSSSTVIKEYICSNGMPNAVESTCPTGYTCQDGACKPTVAPTIPSSGRCSDGSVCSWCGNQCVKFTSGMQCPTVMPPQGATCTCVNNTCTVQYGSTSLMDTLNKLSASLASLIELLKR